MLHGFGEAAPLCYSHPQHQAHTHTAGRLYNSSVFPTALTSPPSATLLFSQSRRMPGSGHAPALVPRSRCQRQRRATPSAIRSSHERPHFPLRSRHVIQPPHGAENSFSNLMLSGITRFLPSHASSFILSPVAIARALATPHISPRPTPAPSPADRVAAVCSSIPTMSCTDMSTHCAQL